jgi:aspartate/glutamate racemase
MVSGSLTIIADISDKSTERYYNMIENNYRWRMDIFISGVTNFTDTQITEILKAGTKPQFDAQRSPTVQRSVVPIK